jgi:pimeloyl-ACP methyl ester carboxylesterase
MVPGFVLDDVVRQARVGPLHRFAQSAGTMPQHLLDGRLGEVTVPVELVWGDADGLMTLDYARRVQAGLPDARLHRVAGCGHVPQRECPVELVEALLKALAKEGG